MAATERFSQVGNVTGSSATSRRRLNLLLGLSGSVAAIKLEELAEGLSKYVELKIVATQAAMHFVNKQAKWGSQVIEDNDDWRLWRKKGDPVQHIELRKWANFLLIAPLSANTLAKIAHGLCDNLLTCIVRAWDPEKYLLLAPAMNSYMWENPVTREQLDIVENRYKLLRICGPVVKTLACGDRGAGAMKEVVDLVSLIKTFV